MTTTTRTKACRTCDDVKPAAEFYKHPTATDGLFGSCKVCIIAREKRYRANPAARDRSNARKAAWRRAHKEQERKREADSKARRLTAAADEYKSGSREFNLDLLSREVGYDGAHDRVRRAFGRAPRHACEAHACHAQASAWALVRAEGPHVREAEVLDSRTGSTRVVRYSLSPRDYRPLCHGCHVRLDAHRVDVFAASH